MVIFDHNHPEIIKVILNFPEFASAPKISSVHIHSSIHFVTTVILDFVFITSIASTKSGVVMVKVQEILLNNNIDISNTRFSCLEGNLKKLSVSYPPAGWKKK